MSEANRDVRGRLRDDAGDDYELLKGALKSALESDKPLRRRCGKCGHWNEFQVPDNRARVDAAAKGIEMGFGRPPSESPDEELDWDVDVSKMSLEERAALRKRILRNRPDLAEMYGAK